MNQGQGLIFPKADYSKTRVGLPTTPVDLIPPICEGAHFYHPVKYVETAAPDPVSGTIVDPFGDDTSDLKMVAGYNKPATANTTSMGGKKTFQYPESPATRIVMKGRIATYSLQWTIHLAYALAGAVSNKCVFSFVSHDKTKVIRFQADSGVDGKPHLQTHQGVYTPLGAGNSLAAIKDAILSYAVAYGAKEFISIGYDFSVDGGTFYVYRNGVLKDTITNVGIHYLNGDLYLGNDIMSTSTISDFKGGIGAVLVYDTLQKESEIVAINSFLNAAFV